MDRSKQNIFFNFESQLHGRILYFRMIVTMNNNEKVSQLRQYITVARPSYAETEFVLLAGHPSKVIEDESVTLEAAYLSNAVVVAQIKK